MCSARQCSWPTGFPAAGAGPGAGRGRSEEAAEGAAATAAGAAPGALSLPRVHPEAAAEVATAEADPPPARPDRPADTAPAPAPALGEEAPAAVEATGRAAGVPVLEAVTDPAARPPPPVVMARAPLADLAGPLDRLLVAMAVLQADSSPRAHPAGLGPRAPRLAATDPAPPPVAASSPPVLPPEVMDRLRALPEGASSPLDRPPEVMGPLRAVSASPLGPHRVATDRARRAAAAALSPLDRPPLAATALLLDRRPVAVMDRAVAPPPLEVMVPPLVDLAGLPAHRPAATGPVRPPVDVALRPGPLLQEVMALLLEDPLPEAMDRHPQALLREAMEDPRVVVDSDRRARPLAAMEDLPLVRRLEDMDHLLVRLRQVVTDPRLARRREVMDPRADHLRLVDMAPRAVRRREVMAPRGVHLLVGMDRRLVHRQEVATDPLPPPTPDGVNIRNHRLWPTCVNRFYVVFS